MSNYYEILQIQPTATLAEVQSACDSQYNYWRRLVTHHEPQVVNKANQALQVLEQIRQTLTDSKKRAIYDKSLHTSLTDPQARAHVPRPGGLTPPPHLPDGRSSGTVPPVQPRSDERVDVWTCPKCNKVNALNSKFCKKCGHTVGLDCPDCSQTIEAIARFCPHCGTNVPNAVRRQQLEASLASKQVELASVEQIDPQQDEEVNNLKKTTVSAGAWMGLGLALAINLLMRWALVFQGDGLVPNLIPGSFAIGVQGVIILVLVVARRTFTFSTLVACVVGLAMIFPELWSNTAGLTSIFASLHYRLNIVLSGVYVLAVWGLGSKLARYGCWTRILTILTILFIICAIFSPFWWGEIWHLVHDYHVYLGDYQTAVSMTNVGCYLLDAILLGILVLRAWWLTHRIEHKVAVALSDKQNRMERLELEIWNLSQEIGVLQQSKERNANVLQGA